MENQGGEKPAAAKGPNAQETPREQLPNSNGFPAAAARLAAPASMPAPPLPTKPAMYAPVPASGTTAYGITPMGTSIPLQQHPNASAPRVGKLPHRSKHVPTDPLHKISTLVSSTKAPEKPKKKTAVPKKKKGGRRRFTPLKRGTESSSDGKKSEISIVDDQPNRLVNPLLDIPPVDTLDLPNHAAEMFVWSDVIFARPDTYPLSYYARLLGFKVPPTPSDKYVALDAATIPMDKDVPHIPSLGSAADMWKGGDDKVLDFKDPVYTALLNEQSDISSHLKRANLNNVANRFLKSGCLKLAKELLGGDLPEFKISDKGGEFGIVASDGSTIRYQFMWYQFANEKQQEAPKIVGPYGVSSLAGLIKKPTVSELTLCIEWIGMGEPPVVVAQDKSTDLEVIKNPAAPSATENKDAGPQPSTAPQASTSSQASIPPISKSDTKPTSNHVAPTSDSKGKNEGNNSGARGQTADIPNERVLIVLTALALEHARACDVFYGLAQVPEVMGTMLSKYYGMVPLKKGVSPSSPFTMLCDLNNCSSRYAFLLYKAPSAPEIATSQDDQDCDLRMLIRLPHVETVKFSSEGAKSPLTKPNRKLAEALNVKSATGAARSLAFSIRVDASSETISSLKDDTATLEATNFEKEPSWNLLRLFPKQQQIASSPKITDEIFDSLSKKQEELLSIESQMEPRLRSLLQKSVDERLTFERNEPQREEDKRILREHQTILEQRKEMDMAFQKQRDQDMDAVCEICNDGEVTPDNQILFCEACNVAVHQYCYGIDRVPAGDYYCIACRYFGRDTANTANNARQAERESTIKLAPSPLPINCELCPRKQGAFIRTDTSSQNSGDDKLAISKWVHVLCAKWQGLHFIDDSKRDCVEDVSKLKLDFRIHDTKCMLCEGDRGAFNQCREEECKAWLHITCARSYGRCEVVHGENCHGGLEHNPWSLLCPEHSTIEDPPKDCSSLEQLVMWAKAFPPEPKVEKPKPNKGFGKLTGKERKEFLSEPKNEQELVTEIFTKRLHGVRCEVCNTVEEEGKNLTKCGTCSIIFCDSCKLPFDNPENKQFTCQACQLVATDESPDESNAVEEVATPSCVLCVQKGGWLRKAKGFPIKKWKLHNKLKMREYQKTLFEKDLWAHPACIMWQPPTNLFLDETKGEVNLNNVIMTHGRGFILGTTPCQLCGNKAGMKVKCSHPNCRQRGQKTKSVFAHVTCAKQAGFEVGHRHDEDGNPDFYVNCYRHVDCEYAFRARLEDLFQIEERRVGKRWDESKSMSITHASRLLNAAIVVMQYLGWAWRWGDWWVEYGDNWEPLLEQGQDESKMTKEQLKIVESTPESRCEDARKCRLAALSAALRNRAFDDEEGGPTVLLDRALRALLSTKSLVGPLKDREIDFFALWLGIAYRSKSRLMGFGDDKIPIDEKNPSSLHEEDKSPKFVLGNRRLPGKQMLSSGQVFESDFTEIDDFLKPEKLEDGTLYSESDKGKQAKQKASKKKAKPSAPTEKRPVGRPPKRKPDPPEVVARPPKRKIDPPEADEDRPRPAIKRGRGRPPKKRLSEASETTPEKAVPTEAPSSPQSSKRQRKSPNKSDFYYGGADAEPVLATNKVTSEKIDRKSSDASDPAENGESNNKRLRRRSAPTRLSEDTSIGSFDETGRESRATGDVKADSATKQDAVPGKRGRGRPKKSPVKREAKVEIDMSAAAKEKNRTRKKRRVSYNEEDSIDFEEHEITDKHGMPGSTKAKKKKAETKSTAEDIYRIPRKGKTRRSIEEEPEVPEDPEDLMPISALPGKKGKKGEIQEDQDDTVDDPEPDLSSPQKRGRHRGKIEAAKFVLPGAERSIL